MPTEVVRLLRDAGVGKGHQVLDLACGKGSVAIALAQNFGCRVLGVEAFAPFLATGRAAAKQAGLAHLTRFRLGNVDRFETGRVSRRFDAAIMLNLYGCERGSRILRRWTKPGGVYVIDDAFRVRATPATRHVPTLEQCRADITALGDTIESEFIPSPARVRSTNTALTNQVAAACARMALDKPRLRPALRTYVRQLRAAEKLLGTKLRPAIWVVRRQGP